MSSDRNLRYFSKNKRLKDSSHPNKRFCVSSKESIKENPKHEILQDKVVYFEKILNTLKSDLSDDNRELFAINALEESVGHEVNLCCSSSSSHCIEILLPLCKDRDVWKRYMAAFSKYKEVVCTNPSASHITELLLYYSVQNIKNWESIMEKEDDSETKQVSFFISWITEFGEFLLENLFHFLENRYACHVACSVLNALGGQMTPEFKSKNALKHTKQFSSEYGDESQEYSLDYVTLEKIPKIFKDKLKQISRTVRETKHISNYVTQSFSVPVFQALVLVVERRLPKQFAKLVTEFTAELLSEKNDKGVPFAILHKNCSFLVEKLFQASNEEFQTLLWKEHMFQHAEYLALHTIGQFFIQKLFDNVKEQSLLLSMLEVLIGSFDKILEAGHTGVFTSIASACVRLKAHQVLFMKSMMQCLGCFEPEERQLQLVPLLLCFKKYEDYNSQIQVCLKGSLLTQKLLAFQKSIKLVKSFLSLKSEEILYLACHIQGCHVLTTFFRSSWVGEKNKDIFIQSFQPILLQMSCDRDGSLTLSRLWLLLSLKQKTAVAEILAHHREKLTSTKEGNIVFNKFKIFYYMHKYEVWKKMQNDFVQKAK